MRLLLLAAIGGFLGAVIGAAGVFILAGGLPEGAIMGAILGGSGGILIAARLDARQRARSFAATDPESASRSAARLSARSRLIRRFERDGMSAATTGHHMSKLEEFAADAEQTRADEGQEKRR